MVWIVVGIVVGNYVDMYWFVCYEVVVVVDGFVWGNVLYIDDLVFQCYCCVQVEVGGIVVVWGIVVEYDVGVYLVMGQLVMYQVGSGIVKIVCIGQFFGVGLEVVYLFGKW